jgi:hypothetical protein
MSGIEILGFSVKLIFMVWIGIIMLGATLTSLFALSLVGFGIMLALWLIWWTLLDGILLSGLGHQRVLLNKDQFAIELWLFNSCRNRKLGMTWDIQDVFQSVLQIGDRNSFQLESKVEKEMVTIQTGERRYSFGLGLSPIECVWLAQEIKDWLSSTTKNRFRR